MNLRQFQETMSADLYRPNSHNRSKGFAVYQKGLLLNLRDQLADAYPVCAQVLDDNFNFFCREMAFQHPSQHRDLQRYGASFGDFLRGRMELASMGWIASLADLEWAWYQVQLRLAETTPSEPLEKCLEHRVVPLWSRLQDDPEATCDLPEEGACRIRVWIEDGKTHLASSTSLRGSD